MGPFDSCGLDDDKDKTEPLSFNGVIMAVKTRALSAEFGRIRTNALLFT